jgi:hypothetical protein
MRPSADRISDRSGHRQRTISLPIPHRPQLARLSHPHVCEHAPGLGSRRTTSENVDRLAADACFTLTEQASEESGRARLEVARSERLWSDRRDAHGTCATESETAPRTGGHCNSMDRPKPEQDPPVAWQIDRAKVVCNGEEPVDGATSLPSCCTTWAQVRRSPHGVRCSLSLR